MTQNISQISEKKGQPIIVAVIVVEYDTRGMQNLRPMLKTPEQAKPADAKKQDAPKPMAKQAARPAAPQKPQTNGKQQMPNTPGRSLGTNPTKNRTVVDKTDYRLTPNKAKEAQRREQQIQLTPQQKQWLIQQYYQRAA